MIILINIRFDGLDNIKRVIKEIASTNEICCDSSCQNIECELVGKFTNWIFGYVHKF